MMPILLVEARRTLARRVTKGIAIAVVLAWAILGIGILIEMDESETFTLTDTIDAIRGSLFFLVLLAWALGSSFVGAEWNHHTISTMLTWEPRRLRVLAAKFVACAAVVFVGALVADALLVGVLLATAGLDEGSGSWSAVVTTVLRVAVASAIASTFGIALATATRNTAAAVGGAFVYLLVVEPILDTLRPGWQPWLLAQNIDRFVSPTGGGFEAAARTPTEAIGIVIAYAAVFVASAFAFFQRRDVT